MRGREPQTESTGSEYAGPGGGWLSGYLFRIIGHGDPRRIDLVRIARGFMNFRLETPQPAGATRGDGRVAVHEARNPGSFGGRNGGIRRARESGPPGPPVHRPG